MAAKEWQSSGCGVGVSCSCIVDWGVVSGAGLEERLDAERILNFASDSLPAGCRVEICVSKARLAVSPAMQLHAVLTLAMPRVPLALLLRCNAAGFEGACQRCEGRWRHEDGGGGGGPRVCPSHAPGLLGPAVDHDTLT